MIWRRYHCSCERGTYPGSQDASGAIDSGFVRLERGVLHCLEEQQDRLGRGGFRCYIDPSVLIFLLVFNLLLCPLVYKTEKEEAWGVGKSSFKATPPHVSVIKELHRCCCGRLYLRIPSITVSICFTWRRYRCSPALPLCFVQTTSVGGGEGKSYNKIPLHGAQQQSGPAHSAASSCSICPFHLCFLREKT